MAADEIRSGPWKSISPFLFRNATPRTGGHDIPGHYDNDLSMWVVGEGDGRRPIIAAGDLDVLEIETKTRVVQEADDDHGTLVRKGRAPQAADRPTSEQPGSKQPDRELRRPSMHLLLELETKTEAELEHDDDSQPVL